MNNECVPSRVDDYGGVAEIHGDSLNGLVQLYLIAEEYDIPDLKEALEAELEEVAFLDYDLNHIFHDKENFLRRYELFKFVYQNTTPTDSIRLLLARPITKYVMIIAEKLLGEEPWLDLMQVKLEVPELLADAMTLNFTSWA
jgi:hypothetical protein